MASERVPPYLTDMAQRVSRETGIDVTVSPAVYFVGRKRQRGHYSIRWPGAVYGPCSADNAHGFLVGFESAVTLVRADV